MRTWTARPKYGAAICLVFAMACDSADDATSTAITDNGRAGSAAVARPDAGPDTPAANGGSGGGGAAADSDLDAGTTVHDAGAPDAATKTAAAVSVELVNPAPGSKFFLGANFWNVDWEGSSDYFASGVNWATTQNPWNPQLLVDLTPYHVLRFMDWNLTNETDNPQAVWETRKQQQTDQTASPVAFEWQIDLCNRGKKDYWVNVPHAASSDYMLKLATLIHDKLDPSLRVYVEWSNEVWNGGFPQREYSRSQGETLGLTGDDKAFAYQVYQSVRAFEAFESVFAGDPARVVKVISGQAANIGVADAHLNALADKTINPKGTQPTAYAVAPYFSGATVDALTSVGIPEATGWISDTYKHTAPAGLPLIAYEGGQDSYVATGGELACAQVQNLAGMHDAYGAFLDAMQGAKLVGPLMQYTHSGNCWGMKQKTSDANASSPKYQGMLDWLAKHP